MDYIKDKNALFVIIFVIFLLLLIVNKKSLHDNFSLYIEHSKKIEPSMLQVRMSQYKKILKTNDSKKEIFEKQLLKLLK